MRETIYVICLCLLIGSCRHDAPAPGSQSTAISGKLKQMVTTYSDYTTDTTFENFFYDSAGRLIRESFLVKYLDQTGVMNEQRGSTEYVRDPLGRLKTCLAGNIVYQSATTTRVAYIGDSAYVFTYYPDGLIGLIQTFERRPPDNLLKRTTYELFYRDSRGNAVKREMMVDYNANNELDGVFRLTISRNFVYDTLINPLFPVDDALIFDKWHVSPNNIIQQRDVGLGFNVSLPMRDFRYRPDGKPLSWTATASGVTTTVHCYYY